MISGTPGWGICTFGGSWAGAASGHDERKPAAASDNQALLSSWDLPGLEPLLLPQKPLPCRAPSTLPTLDATGARAIASAATKGDPCSRASASCTVFLGMPVLAGAAEPSVRLITLDPGHFHAALIQKEMYDGVSPTVNVYAPLGPDLLGHLGRVAAFNQRAEKPTSWRLEVHTGPDFFERMLREKPGNVVVISGRNRGKIDRILASVEAGLHVLADKPWLIDEADLPKLRKALDTAEAKGLVAYDVMTERYEITTILQGELARDPDIAGRLLPGTPAEPTFYIDSVHNLMKTVSGAPLIRPSWFFDTDEQGEALADVGTHLVDLAAFVLFPGQAMAETDARILAAKRWPTTLSASSWCA